MSLLFTCKSVDGKDDEYQFTEVTSLAMLIPSFKNLRRPRVPALFIIPQHVQDSGLLYRGKMECVGSLFKNKYGELYENHSSPIGEAQTPLGIYELPIVNGNDTAYAALDVRSFSIKVLLRTNNLFFEISGSEALDHIKLIIPSGIEEPYRLTLAHDHDKYKTKGKIDLSYLLVLREKEDAGSVISDIDSLRSVVKDPIIAIESFDNDPLFLSTIGTVIDVSPEMMEAAYESLVNNNLLEINLPTIPLSSVYKKHIIAISPNYQAKS